MSYKKYSFEAFGVITVIESNNQKALAEIVAAVGQIVQGGFAEVDPGETPVTFLVDFDQAGNFEFYKEGKLDVASGPTHTFVPYLMSLVRIRIAERAVSRVFVHAGAVVWRDRALIFPASSFKGKTTVVAELVRQGAVYLSDEYAIFDENGMVRPFPKTLSIRGADGGFAQTETPVEQFGGRQGVGPYPPGLVLFTEFSADSDWEPTILSPGQGMLEILNHTIPIRYNPEFSLKVLNKILNRAIIAKSKRGEARNFAEVLLGFCNDQFN